MAEAEVTKKTKVVQIVSPMSAIWEHFGFASDKGKHSNDKHVVCLHYNKAVGFSENTINPVNISAIIMLCFCLKGAEHDNEKIRKTMIM